MPKTNSVQAVGYALMNEVEEILRSNSITEGMSRLAEGLKEIRGIHTPNEWLTFAQTDFYQHSLAKIIYQDPFTRHSRDKPRGYPGDAELLDYIYGFRLSPEDSTALGAEIFNYTTNMAAPQSVRARRDILAKTINRVASSGSHPIRVLSIACGHLREANKLEALSAGMIEEFIALDRDRQSLELIDQELSGLTIQTIQSSVTTLIRGQLTFENLDLVYATGLYDYLSQSLATRLTKILFDMLLSGGKLLVANFVPNHLAIGYMETFMQWNLVYRTEKQLMGVAQEIPAPLIASKHTFFDPLGNIVFLELVRA